MPKNAPRDTYVEFLLEQLTPLGVITVKSLFGGKSLYCDGVVFALVANGTLYLKADEVSRGRFAAAGLPAFRPFENQPDMAMSYYLAPAAANDDRETLLSWAREAVEAARRSGAARRKPKKP